VNTTDKIIKIIRSDISDIAVAHDKSPEDLYRFVKVKDRKSYNFVIDSLYLLEDTQLAKESFLSLELPENDFGHVYLLFYGVLNACYMQQQSILVICRELGITENTDLLRSAEIFDYRNSFSAHSANRGRGKKEHSFILDRHAMLEGKVKGYSSNHVDGHLSKNANIYNLINEWSQLLEKQITLVGEKIID
jgi:hypothetical protein